MSLQSRGSGRRTTVSGAYGYMVGGLVYDRFGVPGRVLQINTRRQCLLVAWRYGTRWVDLTDLSPSLAERQDRPT